MSDAQFKDEARGWDVNEVALTDANYPVYGPLMQDDFKLFDEYKLCARDSPDHARRRLDASRSGWMSARAPCPHSSPLPTSVAAGLPVPLEAYVAIKE